MSANAATLMLISAGVTAVGTISSMRSQQAALNRENYRLETESKMAALAATQEENARRKYAEKEKANNLAYQSIAGYADDSMSFLNMNKQVVENRNKDISDIRLMGKSVDLKYRQMAFENQARMEAVTFGGYTSAIAGLVNGYGNYKYYS
jgi:Tfp pilus assembly protein PilV